MATWFEGGNTTAAGVIAEHRSTTPLHLLGYTVAGSTVNEISTRAISIWFGDSSVSCSTHVVCPEPGVGMLGVAGIIGISGKYIALVTSAAHADGGLIGTLWGA